MFNFAVPSSEKQSLKSPTPQDYCLYIYCLYSSSHSTFYIFWQFDNSFYLPAAGKPHRNALILIHGLCILWHNSLLSIIFFFTTDSPLHTFRRLHAWPGNKKQCVFTRTHLHPNLCKRCNLQASYSGVTVPSFHSIRISPRCKVGEEWGRRMACSVSGALSLGTGDPGMLTSGLGV